MSDLSLVVIAKNEERTIGEVLAAASPLVSEIVVVDSGSTDRTVQIAERQGARVVFQSWLGYSAQKNFALSLASNEWVLSLDADEVLSPELVAEIQRLKEGGSLFDYDGFEIPRILYIGDVAITHGGFYPDAQLRLFRRSRGKFNERAVHERVFVDGKVGKLQHAIRHYSYRDVAGFADAMERYARLSAQHYMEKGYGAWRVSMVNEILHPLWTFFYRYVVRAGFLDGTLGLKLNLIYSDYVRKKIRYLKEAARAKSV